MSQNKNISCILYTLRKIIYLLKVQLFVCIFCHSFRSRRCPVSYSREGEGLEGARSWFEGVGKCIKAVWRLWKDGRCGQYRIGWKHSWNWKKIKAYEKLHYQYYKATQDKDQDSRYKVSKGCPWFRGTPAAFQWYRELLCPLETLRIRPLRPILKFWIKVPTGT